MGRKQGGKQFGEAWTKTRLARGARSLIFCIIVTFMALFSLYEGADTKYDM